MEAWRPESEDGGRRPVTSVHNLMLALVAHVAVFAVFFLYSVVHGLFKDDEKIIPIDLTIVVNENLDGKEDEPPPLDDPPPPPPKQKPKPKPKVKKPDPPKPLEQIVTNVTAKVDKKDEPKEEEKKAEEKKPEEPKKTAKQLREERIKAMRNRAKNTNKKPVQIKVPNQPSGNGRTDKKTLSDAEIMKLLNAGYKPGKTTQLAQSDAQLGYSLIKQAFESKWDTPPWTADLRPMTIRVWFGPGGRILNFKLESSSGDARADQSIKTAASRVGTVYNLPASFIDAYRTSGVPVRFTVRPQ